MRTIRKVENGYIVTNAFGLEFICLTLEDIFLNLLMGFEGRSPKFHGDSYGNVEITRGQNETDSR